MLLQFGLWGSGLWGSGFRVQGSGFRVQGLGFMVLGFRVSGFRLFRTWKLSRGTKPESDEGPFATKNG